MPANKVEGCVSQVRHHVSVGASCSGGGVVDLRAAGPTMRTTPDHARQVWVKPELQPDGVVMWKADSDSQLTKVRGRAAFHPWLRHPKTCRDRRVTRR